MTTPYTVILHFDDEPAVTLSGPAIPRLAWIVEQLAYALDEGAVLMAEGNFPLLTDEELLDDPPIYH